MSGKRTYPEQLDSLLEEAFDGLQRMTDKEVLDGQDPEEVMKRASQRLEWGASEAGRVRLTAAKSAIARAALEQRHRKLLAVSIADARAYIARSTADSRYTLAARQLDELSDEDVLRLYGQLTALEADYSSSDT